MSAVIAGRRDGFVNANATPTSVIRPLSCFITYDLFYGRLVLFHFLSCLRRVNRCPLYRVLLTVSQLLNHSNRYCLAVFVVGFCLGILMGLYVFIKAYH